MAPGDSTPPTPEEAIQQGLDAPVPGADVNVATPDGQGWQQQLILTLQGLTTAVQDFQRRQADQPIKSEKLQPATNLADLLPHEESPQQQNDAPDFGDESTPEPMTVETTATAAAPAFQQQQVAGAVNMGQGVHDGAAVLEQLQAALQAQQQSNQQTVSLLQTMTGMLAQLTQMQQQHAKDLEGVNKQIDGLKAIIESLAEQVQQGQQRNPQNWRQNP